MNSDTTPNVPTQPIIFLDLKQVIQRTGRGKSTIYADATFPKPVKDGGKNKWIEHEIVAWQQARINERDDALKLAA
jgi:predicted DNA-binding transcriptional regulator AlpA